MTLDLGILAVLGALAAYGLFGIVCDALDYILDLRRDLRKD